MIIKFNNNIYSAKFSLLLTLFLIVAVALIPEVSIANSGGLILKDVQITKPNQSNLPPKVIFTSTLISKIPFTVTFDATASSDPDGNITEYRWDFGDGAKGTGITTTHTYKDPTKIYDGTLMVKDDKGAVSLAGNITNYAALVLESASIKDSFDTDTSTNYTPIIGQLLISKGKAHGKAWYKNTVYYKSALTSSDHWVQADVSYNGLYDSGGVIARVNPATKTGYRASFGGGKIYIGSFAGTLDAWVAQYDGKYKAGIYTVKLECVGSTLKVYVNGALVITKKDTTYTSGKNVGFYLSRGSANADTVVDNFFAGKSI